MYLHVWNFDINAGSRRCCRWPEAPEYGCKDPELRPFTGAVPGVERRRGLRGRADAGGRDWRHAPRAHADTVMDPEHELTVGTLEIIAADLLSGDPGGWRPGEALHASPGLAMR